MITIAIIAFREFLEAFLITGIFLGVSKKLKLRKEREIGLAALVGVTISFLISIVTYFFGDAARSILTEDRAELLSNYLMFFSGFFLAYVVFSLHERIGKDKREIIHKTKNKLENQAFDISLFATIVFLVAREGFEIALFTASTSLFSVFFQNFLGLMIGFSLAGVIGTIAFFAYAKFPLKKVFRATEYMIILLGASMVQVSITEVLERQFNFHLANIMSFGLNFLPGEHTIIGNFLRTFTGIDGEFSMARLLIMVAYGLVIYFIFKHKKEGLNEK
jgi:FTR1 family protein